MATVNLEWDENLGNPPDPSNLLSIPTEEEFYKMTKSALPWQLRGGNGQDSRAVVASAFIEALFRRALVPDPAALRPYKLINRSLSSEYLSAGLELLIEQGLLALDTGEQAGEEEETQNSEVPTFEALQRRADKLVTGLKDDPILAVGSDSLEWMKEFEDRAEDAHIKWFAQGFTWETATATTGTLEVYSMINLLLGPRCTTEVRIDPASIFYTIIGSGGNGGQLMEVMRKHTFGSATGAVPMAPAFLLDKIPSFLLETEWPKPYELFATDFKEYALDLSQRARWQGATREQWIVLVQPRLSKALTRCLPVLKQLLEDMLDDSAALAREIDGLGDALLPGADSLKRPFWKIEALESILKLDYEHLIGSEREQGGTTASILKKIYTRIKQVKGRETTTREDTDNIQAPKERQLTRAMAKADFMQLEAQHAPTLEANGRTNAQLLEVIGDNLSKETVLPKVVLLATKGVRITAYVAASEYLALLSSEHTSMALFYGQTYAYDEDLGEVPKARRVFWLAEVETNRINDLEWHKLDPLNQVILKLKGLDAATEFKVYKLDAVYHDSDTIKQIAETQGKLFDSLGYPRHVGKGKGYSYRGFMAGILRIQTFALALNAEEQKAAFTLVDDLVDRAHRGAAANFKKIVYGPSPADKQLTYWIGPEEEVTLKLEEALESLEEVAGFRRKSGGIFGKKAAAANLVNHQVAGGNKSRDGDDEGDRTPGDKPTKKKKKRGRDKSPGAGGSTVTKGKEEGKSQKPDPKGDLSDKEKQAKRLEMKGIYMYDNFTYSIGELDPALP